MYKLLLAILLVVISSSAKADWVGLNCVPRLQNSQSIVIEFDETLQKVRLQNNNNRVLSATISKNFIYYKEWSQIGRINRLDGVMSLADSTIPGVIVLLDCNLATNKF
jgi:hypothetical protein